MNYVYIFLTILLTVYGQVVLKWRMQFKGELPEGFTEKVTYLMSIYSDLWVLSGFFSAFLASITWALVLAKFELSYAYPFTSLSFVFIYIIGLLVFKENFAWSKMVGLALIVLGVYITAKYS